MLMLDSFGFQSSWCASLRGVELDFLELTELELLSELDDFFFFLPLSSSFLRPFLSFTALVLDLPLAELPRESCPSSLSAAANNVVVTLSTTLSSPS